VPAALAARAAAGARLAPVEPFAMAYAFGDSDPAAHRLRLLADVFARSTRPFLCGTASGTRRLALDLGCGPGYTTHLLAETLDCARVTGLDNSARFISLAKRTGNDRVSFALHDITAVPFPTGPADVIHARFLLTHLQRPIEAIASWSTQLQRDGVLLLEETEWIDTTNPVFSLYVQIVEAMLHHQGNVLYIGPLLDTFPLPARFTGRSSQVRRLTVTNRATAAMFVLNVQAWRDHPFIRDHYPPEVIVRLHADLTALAADPSDAADIEWGIRQVALR
jgi:trans-aconitate 2-methyltransferase